MVGIVATNMQKEIPVVVAPEMMQPKSNKRHVFLTSWASVATALLIMMFIGGAFYVADLKSRECTTSTQTSSSGENTRDYSRTYDRNGEKTREDFHVDEDDQSELIIKKSPDGNIELITGVDFKRKISASYIPSGDMCLLLSGADMEMADEWSTEKNKTERATDNDFEEEDYKISDNKVSDLSILPKVMKPYCQGKPTYWAQKADKNELEAHRQKRGICIRYICYWYRIGDKIYYRCYWWQISCDEMKEDKPQA